jgi:hypothetical protein
VGPIEPPATDAATGLATAFNPNADSFVCLLAVAGGTVYAGGYFTTIGGQTRNNLVALDAATGGPLPVELVAFTATAASSEAVRLTWTTASERNSAAFEVERSTDGRAFAHIATVRAAGNSSASRRYALLDTQLPAGAGQLYYRLRLVDTDGTFAYSLVQVVAFSNQVARSLVWRPIPPGPPR